MDDDSLLRIAAGSFWVPPESEHVVLPDFEMVRYDNGFAYDTAVFVVDSAHSAEEVISEAEAQARLWGREHLYWNGLHDATRPPDLVATLLRRGAVEVERLSVLTLDLRAGPPDFAVPSDVRVEVVQEAHQLDASIVLSNEIFGNSQPPASAVQLRTHRRLLADGRSRTYIAYLDGEPVATAGMSFPGGPALAKLWGGATLPTARGRRAYRAVLDARLRDAADHGTQLAHVSGRLATSAPILRRAGFVVRGEELILRSTVQL